VNRNRNLPDRDPKRLRKPPPPEHQQQRQEEQLQYFIQNSLIQTRHYSPKMLTKYLTSVTTAFSPFNPKSGKTARNFLALLPPTAHKTMTIDVKVLSQAQKVLPATLALKFSMFERGSSLSKVPGMEKTICRRVLKVLALTTMLF